MFSIVVNMDSNGISGVFNSHYSLIFKELLKSSQFIPMYGLPQQQGDGIDDSSGNIFLVFNY